MEAILTVSGLRWRHSFLARPQRASQQWVFNNPLGISGNLQNSASRTSIEMRRQFLIDQAILISAGRHDSWMDLAWPLMPAL